MATVSRESNALLKTCPYNPAHKVKASRFQIHVSNCAYQNALTPLRVCPFNASHRLPEEEYQEHLLSCPDNRSFLRSVESLVKKEEKLEPKEDEEDYRMKGKDTWSDQYNDTSSLSNYDVLNDTKVTAEWLFNKRFDGGEDITFTDNIYVQRMSYEERRKYQMLCVQKIKEQKSSGTQSTPQTFDQNKNQLEQPIESNGSSQLRPELIKDIRSPTIANPFARGNNDPNQPFDSPDSPRVIGIGRGLRSRGLPFTRSHF